MPAAGRPALLPLSVNRQLTLRQLLGAPDAGEMPARDGDHPAAVTETANSTTRTTTDTYDNAGRPIKVAVSGGTGTAVADTTTAYDPATGSKTSVTADGRTVGYTYDAFGRTIAQADGSQLAYFTNDLVQRETNGATRQTWTLDPAGRPAAWSTESSTNGTWTTTATKANHYNGDSDSPAWTTEDATGTVTRNVHGIDGDLAATTDATGNTVLQLANIHGDTTVQLPLDTAKNPGAQSADEYGNPTIGTPTSRYGWLGAKQRSAETPTGLVLMGVRLYNPATGRFLSVDPVPGGSDNGYEYGGGDPVNHFDLDGRMWGGSWFQQKWRNPNVRHWVYGVRAAAAVVSPVKKIRFVGRAIRNPSRTLRACARASIWGKKSCYSSLTGIPSALNYGRKAIRNYSYMRDYNRALTYTDRENICRRYTGYRGRGSCD